jgi:hypothetical protein
MLTGKEEGGENTINASQRETDTLKSIYRLFASLEWRYVVRTGCRNLYFLIGRFPACP